VLSGTIKKRKSFVPETIKKRLESYPGWSDLVRLRKNGPNISSDECRHFFNFELPSELLCKRTAKFLHKLHAHCG